MVKIDIDMPKSCKDCPMAVCYRRWSGDPGDVFCGYTKDEISLLWAKRPDFCPLRQYDVYIAS